MKDIVIPDVHGRTFWKKILPFLSSKEYDRFIFLGDYLDPYTIFEGITAKEAFDNFKEILKLAKNNRKKIVLLLGNHDLGYLDPDICECRKDYDREEEIARLFRKNLSLFNLTYTKPCKHSLFSKVLYSHAGFTPWYYKSLGLKKEFSVEDLNEDLHNPEKLPDLLLSLGIVGFNRGGDFPAGSVVWADLREMPADKPVIENTFQIFGHTQLEKSPYIQRYAACLDVRRPFVVKYNPFEITEL